MRSRLRRIDALDRLCVLGLGGLAAAFFAPHLTGARLFIGNPDRINTFLNIRKYAVDSLREFGRITAWNDKMFAGYDTSGLHWMLPELDPFGYLGALLPEAWLFWYSGWISCVFLFLAGGAFFALSRSYVENRLAAFASASMYVFSSFAVTRLAQVDWAFVLLALSPLAVLVLRRSDRQPMARSFLRLTVLIVAMATLSFLQEVSYVFAMLVLYASYRAVSTHRWRTLVVCLCAVCVGVAIASPRIYTVYESFVQLDRGPMETSVSAAQIFRWLNDGIFGRHPSEVAAASNAVTLSEGLQLYSSTFATLVILGGIARWRHAQPPAQAILFMAVFGWILGQQTSIWIAAGGVGAAWLLGRLRGWATPEREHEAKEPDEVFCVLFLGLSLAVVLLDDVRFVLDQASFGVDFTHSRIVVAALVPLNILLARYLAELWDCRRWDSEAPGHTWPTPLLVPAAAAGALLAALVLSKSWIGLWLEPGQVALRLADRQGLVASELTVTMVAIGVFVALMLVAALVPRVRNQVAATLGILMVMHAFHGAYDQIWSTSTQTYPAAFNGQNNYASPAAALQPPERRVREALQDRLENVRYRTVILGARNEFSGFPQPHLAEFYGLRLLGGYSTGVPVGLAGLPWPDGVREPRTLSFPTREVVDWPLLAFANVKYVALLDAALYHNVRGDGDVPVAGLDVDRVRVLENPLPVVPRHFFTSRVQPSDPEAQSATIRAETSSAPILDATALAGGDIMLTWRSLSNEDGQLFIERRDGPNDQFRELGVVPSSAQSFLSRGLDPGRDYGFRIRAEYARGGVRYSRTTQLQASPDGTVPPQGVAVEWVANNEVLVTWTPRDGVAVVLEVAPAFEGFGPVAISESGAGFVRGRVPQASSLRFRARAVTDAGHSPHSIPTSLHRIFRHDPRAVTTSDHFPEARTFSTEGELRVTYQGDRVEVEVTASSAARFLVLNEQYDERWQATAAGSPLKVSRSNGYMRGVEIPPSVTRIELRFVPFLRTPLSAVVLLLALGLGVLAWCALRATEPQFAAAPALPRPLSAGPQTP